MVVNRDQARMGHPSFNPNCVPCLHCLGHVSNCDGHISLCNEVNRVIRVHCLSGRGNVSITVGDVTKTMKA